MHSQTDEIDNEPYVGNDSGLVCQECDRPLIETDNGFCCPRGHGRLIERLTFETVGGFWEELEDEDALFNR
jgi:hypothetical protein